VVAAHPLLLIVLAAVAGSVTRSVLGYLGEAEEGEPFSLVKLLKTLARGAVGGAVIGVYCYYYSVVTDPLGAFLIAFTGAITVDLVSKNVWDAVRRGERRQEA